MRRRDWRGASAPARRAARERGSSARTPRPRRPARGGSQAPHAAPPRRAPACPEGWRASSPSGRRRRRARKPPRRGARWPSGFPATAPAIAPLRGSRAQDVHPRARRRAPDHSTVGPPGRHAAATSSPDCRRCRTKCRPTKPSAPVTSTLTRDPSSPAAGVGQRAGRRQSLQVRVHHHGHSSAKLTVGVQPSSRRALVGSARSTSTSAGPIVLGIAHHVLVVVEPRRGRRRAPPAPGPCGSRPSRRRSRRACPAAASATSPARSRPQSPSRAWRRGCRAAARRARPSLMRATPSRDLARHELDAAQRATRG